MPVDTIETPRLVLRRWQDADRAPFAAMNADPEVMRYFPGTATLEESNLLLDQIEARFERVGCGLWAAERRDESTFVGFVGLADVRFDAHFTPAVEIGWRLARGAWKRGYATEAASAVVVAAFGELDVDELVSFTAVDNEPSRAVMRRIGMLHDAEGDFDHPLLAVESPLRRHVLYRLARP